MITTKVTLKENKANETPEQAEEKETRLINNINVLKNEFKRNTSGLKYYNPDGTRNAEQADLYDKYYNEYVKRVQSLPGVTVKSNMSNIIKSDNFNQTQAENSRKVLRDIEQLRLSKAEELYADNPKKLLNILDYYYLINLREYSAADTSSFMVTDDYYQNDFIQRLATSGKLDDLYYDYVGSDGSTITYDDDHDTLSKAHDEDNWWRYSDVIGEEKFWDLVSKYGIKFSPTNLLIEGPAGGGKSQIIGQWATYRSIKLESTNASSIAKEDVGSLPYARKRKNKDTGEEEATSWSPLYGEKFSAWFADGKLTVVFIEEFTGLASYAQRSLLQLIQDHIIILNDKKTNKTVAEYVPNFLFTIAACNPVGDGETDKATTKLTNSMFTRFAVVVYVPSPQDTRHYLGDLLQNKATSAIDLVERVQKRINELKEEPDSPQVREKLHDLQIDLIEKKEAAIKFINRKKLLYALIPPEANSKLFDYDDAETIKHANELNLATLNSRTLEAALNSWDGRDIAGFLQQYLLHCNLSSFLDDTDIMHITNNDSDENYLTQKAKNALATTDAKKIKAFIALYKRYIKIKSRLIDSQNAPKLTPMPETKNDNAGQVTLKSPAYLIQKWYEEHYKELSNWESPYAE